MLEITGTVTKKDGKQEYYNERVVTPQEFAEIFNCPPLSPSGDMVLQLVPERIKKDQFGQTRTPASIVQASQYTLYVDGGSVSVRYYTSKVPKGNGVNSYAPTSISFSGQMNAFGPSTYEQFLFLYASPISKNTIGANKEPMIEFFDPAEFERQVQAQSDKFAALIQEITAASDLDVTAVSRAIVINGQGTGLSQTAGPAQHRAALIRLLTVDAAEFERQWRSDDILVRGLAREVFNKNLVVQTTVSGRPAISYPGGEVVMFLDSKQDPFLQFSTFCLQPDNIAAMSERFRALLSPSLPQEPSLASSSSGSAKSPLYEAVEAVMVDGRLFFGDGNWKYVDADGKEEPVMAGSGDWEGDLPLLEKFFQNKNNHLHRKALNISA